MRNSFMIYKKKRERERVRRADERKKQVFPKFDIRLRHTVQTNEWLKVYFEG